MSGRQSMKNGISDMPGSAAHETLVTLFLSGRTSTVAAVNEEALREEEDKGLGALVAWTEEDETPIEYFPDPPCVAPGEDEDELYKPDAKGKDGQNAQVYWKDFAMWHEEDPKLSLARALSKQFVDAWGEKARAAALRRGPTKSLTAMKSIGKSGELSVIEAYVNISNHSVGVRNTSTMDESAKTGAVIKPGQCIIIDKTLEVEHMRFFRLVDQSGWVFDTLMTKGPAGPTHELVLAKMEDVEVGTFWHRIVCKEMVDARHAPVYDDSARTGRLLSQKELVVVDVKCRVRNAPFVHLADGRGWVFVKKPGAAKKAMTWADTVIEECEAEVVAGSKFRDVKSLLPPTNEIVEVGLWTYIVGTKAVLALGGVLHGTYLPAGDIIKVNKRSYWLGDYPQGDAKTTNRWLRLNDGRGWVPQFALDGTELCVEQKQSLVSYPPHFQGHAANANLDKPAKSWMIGVA